MVDEWDMDQLQVDHMVYHMVIFSAQAPVIKKCFGGIAPLSFEVHSKPGFNEFTLETGPNSWRIPSWLFWSLIGNDILEQND